MRSHVDHIEKPSPPQRCISLMEYYPSAEASQVFSSDGRFMLRVTPDTLAERRLTHTQINII